MLPNYFLSEPDKVNFKVRQISEQPKIYLIQDFINQDECNQLISDGMERLKRSTVVNDNTGENYEDSRRTSRNTFFSLAETQIIQIIENRISELLAVPIDNGEGLQLLHYQKGEFYNSHYDYFDPNLKGSQAHLERGGQRFATLIIYLNDVVEGGETAFPNIGLKVLPKAGSALLFYNCMPTGIPDKKSLHSSEKVLEGEKFIVTKWLRERSFWNNEEVDSLSLKNINDNDWYHWVAKNIILKKTEESMVEAMRASGIMEEKALSIINKTKSHPIFDVACELYTLASKREWLLKTLDTLRKTSDNYLQIPYAEAINFKEFYDLYYSQNKPLLLKGGVSHWEATKKWSLQYFKENFGDILIEAQFDRNQNENYELEKEKHNKRCTLKEFCEIIENVDGTNDVYLTAYNGSSNEQLLKLLKNDINNIGDNLMDKDKVDNNFFVWVGPKGTITPFHHDLTNNFLIQLYGTKTVRLISPFQVPYIQNKKHVFSNINPLVDNSESDLKNVNILETVLSPGDALFLPIGWYHHIVSSTISISATLTNFKGPNTFFEGFSDGDISASLIT